MEALIVLALLGILWLVSSQRWRKRFLVPITPIVLICLAIASPMGVSLLTQGITAALPPDSGATVQSIVVLGRGGILRQSRIDVAEQLWREKRAPKIFVSGMTDANFFIEELQTTDIPKKALSGESCSQSTEENAIFSSAVLHPQQVQTILLVTDLPHMLRSVLVFRSLGFSVTPHAIALPTQWSSGEQSLLLLREYVGLLHYAVTGRFKQKSPAELSNPPAEVKRKLVDWNCRVLPRVIS
ncbi:MAG: YdcF family protein [Oscillatoriales cyanobacterium C42_A2020_001]|nr:YdcF family protein [Leptolyngbyaceae cyanobacterium C42_A2020_001]